jgi:hypothetical protein
MDYKLFMLGMLSLLLWSFFLPLFGLTSVAICIFLYVIPRLPLWHAGELSITFNCWQNFGAVVTAKNVSRHFRNDRIY